MAQLSCHNGASCPFQYHCVLQICIHDPLLPPTVYTTFVYLLIPLLLSLANVGGLSGGFLKVPFLMDLLNYPQNTATLYTYPLTFGGGLANFFLLVPQRHPLLDRPVVDYNMVLILLPCVVVGTTLGVISNSYVPQLANDIFIILLFVFIAYLFITKYIAYRATLKENQEKAKQPPVELTDRKSTLLDKQSKQGQQTPDDSKVNEKEVTIDQSEINSEQPTDDKPPLFYAEDIKEIENADKGMRIKDVLISLFIYVIFQVLAMLVQGKLFPLKKCQFWLYAVLFFAYFIFLIGYLIGLYIFMKRRFAHYRLINYEFTTDVSKPTNFIYLVLGGVLGGFSSGLIGLGAGNIMIIFMGLVGVQIKVASATSGYQILFIGSASLIQAVAQGRLTWVPLVFFASLAFVGSFVFSILAYRLCEKLPNKGQGPILLILVGLSFVNIIGVIPNMILTSKYYGFDSLLTIRGFQCPG